MRIDSFLPAILRTPTELGSAVTGPAAASAPTAARTDTAAAPPSFGEVLGKEVGRVNELLAGSDVQAQRVATNDAPNLHEAVIAMAEADLALQVTMRVTQKAIAAYQEISRMQI
jgi:flagellar hook-basal body complex protein FliE